MAAAPAAHAAATYNYGGAQQAYNPYDAYSQQGGASTYHSQQMGTAQQANPGVGSQVFALPRASRCTHPARTLARAAPLSPVRYPCMVQAVSGGSAGPSCEELDLVLLTSLQPQAGAWSQQPQHGAWGQQWGQQAGQHQAWGQNAGGAQQNAALQAQWAAYYAQQAQQARGSQASPATTTWQAQQASPSTAEQQGAGAATSTAGDSSLPAVMRDPQQQGVWEPQRDPKSGKLYWTNHTLQKTLWEPPAGSTPVPADAPPAYPAGAGASQQPGQWGQTGVTGNHPAWGQGAAGAQQQQQHALHQMHAWGQGAGGAQQQHAMHQTHAAQWAAYHARQAAQNQQLPQNGQNPGAQNSAQVPQANSFAWKTHAKKPLPLATNGFQWDDGRRDEDFPPLGRSPNRSGPMSYNSSQESTPNRATHSLENAHRGNHLGANAASQPPADKWPPKLQTFVERAFKQCNGQYERECMQNTLKSIIQNATKNNRMWLTDWDTQPLPRVVSQPGRTDNCQLPTEFGSNKEWRDEKKRLKGPKQKQRRERDFPEVDQEADKEAREKRHKRFIDMERGYSAGSAANTEMDGDTKFMSSEAIEGTCMEMEKMYIRLQSMPDPATVRPERVLVKWAERLQDKYDAEEADWEWISDQFKAIRQDMVIQHIRSANAVKAYETNGRLALQEQDYPEFYKIQSFLMGLYKDNPDASENEPEFLAYRLFYWMLNNNTVDMTKDIRNMAPDIKKNPAIKHAIALHQALELSDYVSFSRLYDETPNQGKCIVDTLRGRLRERALRVLLRVYKPSLPVEFVQAQLGFKITGGIDEMLNSSLGMPEEEEEDDDSWSKFADYYCLLSVQEDPTVLDCKASLDAFSEAERRRAEEGN